MSSVLRPGLFFAACLAVALSACERPVSKPAETAPAAAPSADDPPAGTQAAEAIGLEDDGEAVLPPDKTPR